MHHGYIYQPAKNHQNRSRNNGEEAFPVNCGQTDRQADYTDGLDCGLNWLKAG